MCRGTIRGYEYQKEPSWRLATIVPQNLVVKNTTILVPPMSLGSHRAQLHPVLVRATVPWVCMGRKPTGFTHTAGSWCRLLAMSAAEAAKGEPWFSST